MDTTSDLTDEVAVADGPRDVAAASVGLAEPSAPVPPGDAAATPPPGDAAEGPAADAAAPPATAPAQLLVLYARYLSLFVGAGLMAGAVVHFPLAPGRYAAMGLAGGLVFAVGSAGEALARGSATARLVHVSASLAVALAVGMVAGGIQHFAEVPGRAAVLIPLGLVLGLAAFVVRDGHRLDRAQLVPVAAGALAVTVALAAGLGALKPAGAGADGHGHADVAGHADGEAHGTAEAEAAPGDGHDATAHGDDERDQGARDDADAEEQDDDAGADVAEDDADEDDTSADDADADAAPRTRRARVRPRAGRPARRPRRSAPRMTEDEIVAAVRELEARYVPRAE